jgi:hypothetical protein
LLANKTGATRLGFAALLTIHLDLDLSLPAQMLLSYDQLTG